MKKILFTAIISALALGLWSCGEKDPQVGSSSDLVGEWGQTQIYWIYKIDGKVDDENTEQVPAGAFNIVFNSDGTGYTIFDEDEDDVWNITWKLSGNKLEMTDDEGYTEEMKVEELTSSTLVFSMTYHEVDEGVTYDDYERMTFKKK